MTVDELTLILKEGESLSVEFKEHFTPKIDRDIVAFANTGGGKIILGVNDQGNIVGEALTNDLKAKINDLARNCEPDIAISKIEQIADTVVISIEESVNKPHSCAAGFYRRLDAATQKMNQRELKLLFNEAANKPRYEMLANKEMGWDDISRSKINTFLEEANIKLADINPKALLESLHLASHGNINNAGVLFFAEAPRKLIFHCEMILVAFKGTSGVHIYDRIDVQDDLITQYHQAMLFLRKHLNVRSEIVDERRHDIYEIPLAALREAVVNAIIHRDYAMAGTSLMVEVHEDRVVIKNPGGIVQGLSIDTLTQLSIRRNETIADMFARMDRAERIGSGIKRINDLIAKAGLPKPIIESNLFFSITFQRDQQYSTLSAQTGSEKSSELGSERGSELSSEKILKTIESNPKVTASELADILDISTRAVEKHLANLQKAGRLKRVGARRYGHWEVIW